MEDYLFVAKIMFVVFGILYFIPKVNRQKNPTQALSIYVITIFATVSLAFIYHNSTSILGYQLQHNKGLLGGYLMIAVTVFVCVLWLVIFTINNKRIQLNKHNSI